MRFSNTGTGSRSSWETYATTRDWTLSSGFTTKTVYAQFDIDGNGVVDITTTDSIDYVAGGTSNSCVGGHCADITLRIVSTGGSCEIGESLDLGATGYSNSARDIASSFPTTANTSGWWCDDRAGLEDRRLYIQTTSLENITTNNITHTIDASNVYIKNPAATRLMGSTSCSANE